MEITRTEAMLYLKKWLAEKTALSIILTVFDTDTRCGFSGYVSQVDDKLIFSHLRGNGEAYLDCAWHEVIGFQYVELRDSAKQLSAVPGAEEFMRERPNVALLLKSGMSVLLTDLTPPE